VIDSYDISIERAIFSAIFFDSEVFEDVSEVLNAGDFYLKSHRQLFSALSRLRNKDEPLSEEFIKNEMKEEFDEEAILEILATSPVSNINAYTKEIKSKAIKRNLSRLARELEKGITEDRDNDSILDDIQSKIYSISQDSAQNDFKDSKEATSLALKHIKLMKERGNSLLSGLDTGFKSLNYKTAGFKEGDLIIIAARPSMGKTAFCLNIALKALKRGDGVAVFSLEMPAEQLMIRVLSAYTSIPMQNLTVGSLSDAEWSNLSKACDDLGNKSFFIDDNGNLNINQLKAKLRKLKSKNPDIKLAIIDYLQLMSGSGNKDRHLEVSEISRNLKLLARELAIPIIALSQLNRSLESRSDKRPMLSDLRESGAIEQDADLIMFVYRDDVYKYREEKEKEKSSQNAGKDYKSNFEQKEDEDAEIIIGKQRNGPTGVVKLKFQKRFTRFIDEDEFHSAEIVYENVQRKEAVINIPDDKPNIDMPFMI
jgi:replicative DNA helicase